MPFPLLSQAALKQCTISELKKGTKGQQFAEIRFADETPVFQLSAEPLLSPFSAGVFQDDGSTTRLNMDLQLNEATKKPWKRGTHSSLISSRVCVLGKHTTN